MIFISNRAILWRKSNVNEGGRHKKRTGNIGHSAHFGGAIGGYLITLLKEPHLLIDNLEMVILLAIPIVLLFILAKLGKI